MSSATPITKGTAGPKPLGYGLVLTMAAACGIAVANIYYSQPMLGILKRDFGDSAWVGLIPTATQIGYGLGLFLVVPLGDLMDRRRLIVGQFLLLGAASFAASLAPSAAALVGASLIVGACAAVAQQIIPFAASLSPPERRGGTIGTVMAGLLCGILLSRTLAGFVATYAGWRAMFQLGLPISAGAAIAMAVALPKHAPHSGLAYGAAIKSLFHIWLDEPALRRASLMQGAMFASFSVFWTVLALHLEEPKFGLGADAAGLFGLAGLMGVIVAPLAGRVADRRGSGLVLGLGTGTVILSWALFGLWESLAGMIVGVILLDLGAQATLISNQHMIYTLRPEARSRLNTLFMTTMFAGGALGSSGGMVAWEMGGWLAVCALGAALALAALSVLMPGRSAVAPRST